MKPVFLAVLGVLAACGGPDEPSRKSPLGPGLDRDAAVDAELYRKTLVSRAYPVEPEQLNVHTEPFKIKPFSATEPIWIVRWRTKALSEVGSVAPDDIQCHTLLTDLPRFQENWDDFIGICTDGFTPLFEFPEGFGVEVAAGKRLHFQPMFNNRHPSGCRVRMQLDIDYVKKPLRALRCVAMSVSVPDLYWIPPNKRDVLERPIDMPFTGRVHAIGGHIHPFGKTIELKRERDGKVMCLLRLSDHEKIEDQRLETYASKEGFFVREDEEYLITVVYDNTSNKRADAMGGLFIFFDPMGKPDA